MISTIQVESSKKSVTESEISVFLIKIKVSLSLKNTFLYDPLVKEEIKI